MPSGVVTYAHIFFIDFLILAFSTKKSVWGGEPDTNIRLNNATGLTGVTHHGLFY